MRYELRTPERLAEHLPRLRKARQLTQAQLGLLVGLDQTRIAKIEADPLRIGVGQLLRILHVLRVNVVLSADDGAEPGPPETAGSHDPPGPPESPHSPRTQEPPKAP